MATDSRNALRLRAPQYLIALRSSRVWGWRLALIAFAVYLFAAVIVDVLPKSPGEWLWLLSCEVVAFVTALVAGLVIRKILNFVYRDQQIGSWLNASLFLLVGMLKNAAGSLLIYSNDVFDFGRLTRDLINGAVAATFIGFLFVLVFGVQLYQLQAIDNLQQNQAALEAILSNLEVEVVRHRNELKLSALKVLRPQFEQISKALDEAPSRRMLIGKLSSSIDEGIRPLIGQLNDMYFFIANAMTAADGSRSTELQRLRPDYSADIRPLAIWLAAVPGLIALLIFFQEPAAVIRGALASLMLVASAWCAKVVRGNLAAKLHEHYIFTSTFVALLAATSVSFAASGAIPDAKFLATFALSFVGALGLQIIFLYSGSIDRSTTQVLGQVRQVVEKLETAHQVLQRNLWVERKKWANMLHGRVQALLTGCVIQISSAKVVSTSLRRQIEDAIVESLRIIEGGVSDILDVDQAFRSIVESWAGVCEVEVKISKPSRQALAKDAHLSFVVNSIAKEVVSKFYAELACESLSISINLVSSGNLLLKAESKVTRGEANMRQFDFVKTEFLAKDVEIHSTKGHAQLRATLERIDGTLP